MKPFAVVGVSFSPPIQNHYKVQSTISETPFISMYPLQNCLSISKSRPQFFNSRQICINFVEETYMLSQNSLKIHHNDFLATYPSQKRISNLKYLPKVSWNQLLICRNTSTNIVTTLLLNFSKNHKFIHKTATFLKILISHVPSPPQEPLFILQNSSYLQNSLMLQLYIALMMLSVPSPCFATEATLPSEQVSDKINLESIVISIDDFFNRNPFFVAGVTFIWLFVIPLTQEYLKKYKFISAINAFQKLQNDPNSQLLDIRDKRSLQYLGSPNLKILNKSTVQVQFFEGEEEGFVKKVLENFRDPENTTVCVIDNFDGNSMKVAELLFKNGFKEAYAIKGGIRGKDGWQAIQETLLPPSLHVFPKRGRTSRQPETSKEGIGKWIDDANQALSSCNDKTEKVDNGHLKSVGITPQSNFGQKIPSSPYPNYPDMKPPSSPTPSKPQN